MMDLSFLVVLCVLLASVNDSLRFDRCGWKKKALKYAMYGRSSLAVAINEVAMEKEKSIDLSNIGS